MNAAQQLTFWVAVLLFASCSKLQEPIRGDLLIRGAFIVSVETGQLSQPQDVLVRDELIVDIAAAGGRLVNAMTKSTIDAHGLYLLPGLIDVHAHIGHGGLTAVTLQDREEALAQFVRYGVTTIFVPGGGGGNDQQLLEWKRRCTNGELLCPSIYGSGDMITAYGSHPITTIWDLPANTDPEVLHGRGVVSVLDEAPVKEIIARKADSKMDAIKIIVEDGPGIFAPKPKLSREKIAELVSVAHAENLKVFAHISRAAHVEDVIAAGADGIMHSAEDRLSDQLLAEMANNGAFYVATLSLYDGFSDQAFGRRKQEPYAVAGVSQKALQSFNDERYWTQAIDTPEEATAYWTIIADNLKRADALGVPIALGTDTNNPQVFPGYAVHEELALMVESGLTAQAALAAGTTGGASFLALNGSVGRIRPGFQADMLLLRGNPVEHISHSRTIEYVVANGLLVENIVSAD